MKIKMKTKMKAKEYVCVVIVILISFHCIGIEGNESIESEIAGDISYEWLKPIKETKESYTENYQRLSNDDHQIKTNNKGYPQDYGSGSTIEPSIVSDNVIDLKKDERILNDFLQLNGPEQHQDEQNKKIIQLEQNGKREEGRDGDGDGLVVLRNIEPRNDFKDEDNGSQRVSREMKTFVSKPKTNENEIKSPIFVEKDGQEILEKQQDFQQTFPHQLQLQHQHPYHQQSYHYHCGHHHHHHGDSHHFKHQRRRHHHKHLMATTNDYESNQKKDSHLNHEKTYLPHMNIQSGHQEDDFLTTPPYHHHHQQHEHQHEHEHEHEMKHQRLNLLKHRQKMTEDMDIIDLVDLPQKQKIDLLIQQRLQQSTNNRRHINPNIHKPQDKKQSDVDAFIHGNHVALTQLQGRENETETRNFEFDYPSDDGFVAVAQRQKFNQQNEQDQHLHELEPRLHQQKDSSPQKQYQVPFDLLEPMASSEESLNNFSTLQVAATPLNDGNQNQDMQQNEADVAQQLKINQVKKNLIQTNYKQQQQKLQQIQQQEEEKHLNHQQHQQQNLESKDLEELFPEASPDFNQIKSQEKGYTQPEENQHHHHHHQRHQHHHHQQEQHQQQHSQHHQAAPDPHHYPHPHPTLPTTSLSLNEDSFDGLTEDSSSSSSFLSSSTNGNNVDYFGSASPRSGRHRARSHTLPNNSLLSPATISHPPQPHFTIKFASGFNGGPNHLSDLDPMASKVFRSLPDSDEYHYETTHHYIHPKFRLAFPNQRHWPVKREAIVEGDLILGGLMMVHSREDSIICGPIMPQGGIQALEAMLYTIDRINEQKLLPNITLGAHILDDCDKDSYGLEMAVDFIKGSISNIDDAEYHCNKTQVRKVISGVVGAASSVTSIQVANLLRLFRIPQVSFFSTSPELSNKQRFEYFSRTIPSDHYQVKAMVEIVKRMGWSYVSIIYEESNYGIKAFEELEELLARHNICIAIKEKLVKDSGVAEEIAYDNIVQKLLTKPRARGAIIFGSDQEVREVMRAVRRNNATGAFSWIGSDGWSARNLVSDGNEPEVEGTLSVQPQANPVKGFEEYFMNLTVENNQRNPWFVEFWEDHFQCRYPGSLSTPYNSYNRTCTTTEKLSRENTDFEDQLQFVSDAVMAFAYALKDMHRDLCGGLPSLCDAMKPTKGADLLKYLRKVQFEGLSGDHFRFDGNGDGPARYNIIHFKQSKDGLYNWVKVGEYYEGELRLNMTEVQFKLLHPKPPESVCSLPCERGQAKKYVEGESCCWHCFNCSTYQIRHPIDETQCLICKLGTLPDATKQFCQQIPEVYLRPESAWAIGAMAFSSTGILVTVLVIGVFVRHNDTPIVRASGRELSYILLAGLLMCYAVTFALVLKPTNIVCAIQRFGVGFCFTVVYAALLTKTNRIARIFKAGKQSAKRPSFISPKSQLVICTFLVFIQILINGVWMVIAPSHAMYHHPTREDNLLVCDSYIDASYMIAFFYPIVLIVICTVYAILTRKIPEAFNESKHIGFTMYTTCVIWLAFVPLYFGTANHVPLRITSMSVTISLSASVTIACLFSPKLYIILVRPERNVRQSMMAPRYGNLHRTAGTGPSSMMAAAVVTAATCNQEEKIQKVITPTNTEYNLKPKKLCEMATQTITITSIFTALDSPTYNQIPYADQYVPNSHSGLQTPSDHSNQEPLSEGQMVVNNNMKNQRQTNGCSAPGPGVSISLTTQTNIGTSPIRNHVTFQNHSDLQTLTATTTRSADNILTTSL